ncbi:MAG: MOSC domain-containing protein [Tissierellia bacterium]|nr:MOSC domain-containing protein [Tissierellia bacterium]
MGKVIAICRSEKKGTVKTPIEKGEFIEDFGLKDDAHAGKWHRQVSLLSYESFMKFKDTVKIDLKYGVFGENLLVSGLDLENSKVGDRFKANDVVLEITQIGKKCHKSCEIRSIVGNCIMPTEGIFARVIKAGSIKTGDQICRI